MKRYKTLFIAIIIQLLLTEIKTASAMDGKYVITKAPDNIDMLMADGKNFGLALRIGQTKNFCALPKPPHVPSHNKILCYSTEGKATTQGAAIDATDSIEGAKYAALITSSEKFFDAESFSTMNIFTVATSTKCLSIALNPSTMKIYQYTILGTHSLTNPKVINFEGASRKAVFYGSASGDKPKIFDVASNRLLTGNSRILAETEFNFAWGLLVAIPLFKTESPLAYGTDMLGGISGGKIQRFDTTTASSASGATDVIDLTQDATAICQNSQHLEKVLIGHSEGTNLLTLIDTVEKKIHQKLPHSGSNSHKHIGYKGIANAKATGIFIIFAYDDASSATKFTFYALDQGNESSTDLELESYDIPLNNLVFQSGVIFFSEGYSAILGNGVFSTVQKDLYIKFDFIGSCHETCTQCIDEGEYGCTECKQEGYQVKKENEDDKKGKCEKEETEVGENVPTLGCGGVDISGCSKCFEVAEGETASKKCGVCISGYGLNGKAAIGGSECKKCEVEKCDNCDQEEDNVKCNKCSDGYAYDSGKSECGVVSFLRLLGLGVGLYSLMVLMM